MVWVGEFGKDFLEGLALVLAETIREKRARFLGKLAVRSRKAERAGYCGQTVGRLTCQGQWELEELLARRGGICSISCGSPSRLDLT